MEAENRALKIALDKVIELQQEIDEINRFMADLLVMICYRDPRHKAIVHSDKHYECEIWDEVKRLIENLQSK